MIAPPPLPMRPMIWLFGSAQFFTSVVGPNGSGKSNVIDALLFVFGFKASRIRLKRIGELVHSSTKLTGRADRPVDPSSPFRVKDPGEADGYSAYS